MNSGESRVSNEDLKKFRDKIQSMCFWWVSSKKHGYCKDANGMDHVCCFCELVEELDRLNERKS